MKLIRFVLVITLAAGFASAVRAEDVLKFKAKIGFINEEDTIVDQKIIDNDRKMLIIGEKGLQLWDLENARMLGALPYKMPPLDPLGAFSFSELLRGSGRKTDWQPYLIDPAGKWLITVEKTAGQTTNSAVVRELPGGRQIKVLDAPNFSIDYLVFDEKRNEIASYGQTGDVTTYAKWNRETFEPTSVVSVKNHSLSQFFRNDEKILVIAADGPNPSGKDKPASRLTLRDVKTGRVEKEYTAPGGIPGVGLGTISRDEKFLVTRDDGRAVVWDIDAGGAPRYEIPLPDREKDPDRFQIVGGRFIVIAVDKKLRVYEIAGDGTMKYELVSGKPNDSVKLMSATEDGKYLAVADDRKISVIETGGSGQPVYEFVRRSESERFTRVEFTNRDALLAVGRIDNRENRPESTEFYAADTGKIAFTAPFAMGEQIYFTSDGKFLKTDGLGFSTVFNIAAQKSFTVPLKVRNPTQEDKDNLIIRATADNIETTIISPNEKLLLKRGDGVVSVFDLETGLKRQSLFDADRGNYDEKKNKVKKSGLGKAGWTPGGKYLFALDNGGFSSRSRTVNLWEVTN